MNPKDANGMANRLDLLDHNIIGNCEMIELSM